MRRPSDLRPPVGADVVARWRDAGAWTGESLLDRFVAAPEAYGADGTALVDGARRLTWGAAASAVERVAAGLHARGVRGGDVVAFQLPNWWEAVVVFWATLRLGAVASPITPTLRAKEVGFILGATDAKAVVVPARFRGFDHAAMVHGLGFAGDVVVVRPDDDGSPAPGGAPDDDFTVDAALERDGDGVVLPEPVVDASAPAVVLWTSGTTADPKGVVHSHEGLRHEADSLAVAHAFTRADRQLLPMPVTHVAGMTYGILMPFCLGVPAILMDVWEPGRALDLVARERITVMISTPVFVRQMIDHPSFASADTTSVRLLSLGGAGVAPSTVREGATRFGGPAGCWCKRTYGSTEYPTLTTALPGDDAEVAATTDGRVIGPAELRIVDPATGRDRPDGEAGELWCRGPEMSWGYLDPALDDAAFVDGWFRTGDLAVWEDGCLRIVDRLKDIIIRGGENISALEVEALLLAHPDVADAAVVAVPDPVMGERACAYVIPRPGTRPTLADLTAHLRARGLAPFKLPERLELRAELPRTASGKVQKAPLRAEQANGA